MLSALKLVLKMLGHSPVDFTNPRAALDTLSTDQAFDLILCDLRMPDVDGLGVLSEAKKICPAVPFVLISGHAAEEDVAKARALGAFGFLGKPFTPDQLKELLASLGHVG